MIFGMTYYEICMDFLVYAFIGWCVEVAFHAITQGLVINRGFLSGPICPIYGFGMLSVIAMANMLPKDSASTSDAPVWMLFLGGMVLTTLIELIGGWLLDKQFHTRWWDYSNEKFNFHGYICLKFSIFWGIGVVLLVRYAYPVLDRHTTQGISPDVGWPVMAVLYVLLLIDFIVSVGVANGLDKKLTQLGRMKQSMMAPSNVMSEVIADTTLETAKHVQEGKVQAELGKMELQDAAKAKRLEAEAARLERKERYEEKVKEFLENRGRRRMLRAFPNMKRYENNEILQELKRRVNPRSHKE